MDCLVMTDRSPLLDLEPTLLDTDAPRRRPMTGCSQSSV